MELTPRKVIVMMITILVVIVVSFQFGNIYKIFFGSDKTLSQLELIKLEAYKNDCNSNFCSIKRCDKNQGDSCSTEEQKEWNFLSKYYSTCNDYKPSGDSTKDKKDPLDNCKNTAVYEKITKAINGENSGLSIDNPLVIENKLTRASTSTDYSKDYNLKSLKLDEFATNNNIDINVLTAIKEVESGGNGYYSDGHPVVRFECHIFNNPSKYYCGEFSNNGITFPCTPKSSTQPWSVTSSETNYDAFKKAYEKNSNLTICASSFGSFQIMGFNYKKFGYTDISKFYSDMKVKDNENRFFIDFLTRNIPLSCLKDKNWKCIATNYNGGGQVERYASLLENQYTSIT